MSDFLLYFNLGIEHIADIAAYDHMLFILSLCAIFKLTEWKKVLLLVTAFTIGHSITLALSVLDMIAVNKDWIETLIPITILITCLSNIGLTRSKKNIDKIWLHYFFALFFGLIHGLGFANYLKSLLMGMSSLLVPLFSFNLGIELGQIGIVLTYFVLYFSIKKITGLKHSTWVLVISTLIAMVSLKLIFF